MNKLLVKYLLTVPDSFCPTKEITPAIQENNVSVVIELEEHNMYKYKYNSSISVLFAYLLYTHQ